MFHEDIPYDYLDQIFNIIHQTPHHTYQILTKRPEKAEEYFQHRTVPTNVWLGVSVEDKKYGLPRIDILRRIDAATRFLSVEPLLEDLGTFDLTGIHWVIVGGESGNKARPMEPKWVLDIQEQCQIANISFFFKQWGGKNKKLAGRTLKGRTWDEMPKAIQAA